MDNLSEALGSDRVEPPASRRLLQSEAEEDKCGECGDTEDAEEFRDSTAFLKGTQSLNPHNDYSQNFVDTGQRPQNFIRDTGERRTVTEYTTCCDAVPGLTGRFEEYPKLQELIRLKVSHS